MVEGSSKEDTTDGGEAFLDAVAGYGVDYIFYNSGSDYYPILEHLSQWSQMGRQKPGQILCTSEQLALNMAHGYSMLAKRAQLVLVHAGIGTLQFGGSLHNAHRGRAPVLLASGRAPYTFQNELEGGKDSPHHWDQELFDQAGALREYTKWQYELKTNSNLPHVVGRALQIADSEPQGPVYLILPRELLAEKFPRKLGSGNNNDAGRPVPKYNTPASQGADPRSLERIADLILEAERPIIITEYVGRYEESVRSLVGISELASVGVVELSRRRTNFPTTHPNYLPTFPKEEVESADLVFMVDADVPWVPSSVRVRGDAKVIQLDVDPVKSRYPLWGFPVDIALGGSSSAVLPKLLEVMQEKKKSRASNEGLRERAEKLRSRHDSLRSKLGEVADAGRRGSSSSGHVKIETALSVLNEVKGQDCMVVNEGVSYTKTVENYIDTTRPATFFGIGGSSLGDGAANALGLKLAARDRDVVCVTGDGSFVYSNPITTFWAASRYDLPIVTVLINNGGYIAMKRSVDKFYPAGVSRKTNRYAGVTTDPQPDYVKVAEACGAKGRRVDDPSQLEEAFQSAFLETRSGKAVLIELVADTK